MILDTITPTFSFKYVWHLQHVEVFRIVMFEFLSV